MLKSFQILERELQSRFRQQNADKLLADVECQSALGIGDLGAGNRRLIAGRLQPVLPLVTAFEEVAEPDIKLLRLIQIRRRKNPAD